MIESQAGFWAYRVAERLRLEDPRRSLHVIRVATRRAGRPLLPWLMASAGSALRRLGHFRVALVVFHRAESLAVELGDQECLDQLRHKIAHVYCDLGDFEAAIQQSHAALRSAVQQDDKVAQGKALVGLSKWFYHLENYSESIRCSLGALRLLPDSEADLRFAAMLGIAYCYRDIGDLGNSDRWGEIAERNSTGVPSGLHASLLMHRGMVAMRRGFHSEAVDRFKVAYDFYVERGFFLLAGTAAIELCEAQMLCGRPEEASGTAQATIELIDHLRESPYLRGVIVTLSSHAAAGRPITLRLLAGLRKRLKDAEG